MNPETVLVVFANMDIVDYIKKLLKEERVLDEHSIFLHANGLTSLKSAEPAAVRLQALEGEMRKKIMAEMPPPAAPHSEPAN